MPTSKPFNAKAFLEEWAKELPEYQSKALTELDFRQHEERLMAMMQSQYGVPKDLLMPAQRSGRSAAIAQLEELAKRRGIQIVRPTMNSGIKGKSAVSMFIDEAVPVHPNCRCETVPVASSSLNVTSAHDDMLDALAQTFGVRRHPGEPDSDFRARVKAGMSPTHTNLVATVMSVAGVTDVAVHEAGPGEVQVMVKVDPPYSLDGVLDDVRGVVEAQRPAGVAVHVTGDYVSDTRIRGGTGEIHWEATEEQRFIERLREKILELYPEEE